MILSSFKSVEISPNGFIEDENCVSFSYVISFLEFTNSFIFPLSFYKTNAS